MAYLLTGVQHTTNGDIVIPTIEYQTIDDCKKKYHEEMSHAMNSEDFSGLGIKVFDKTTLIDVFVDNWVRQ